MRTSRDKDKITRYQYAVTLSPDVTKDNLVNALKKIEGVSQIKLSSNELIAS